MVSYRIVLANQHAPLRECLKRLLRETSSLEVVGEVGSGEGLLNLLKISSLVPHLVILDPFMPDFQGTEAIRKVKEVHPDVKVLILSMHRDKEYFSQAILNGAEGYLIQETVDKELLPAIETIRQGRLYVPPFP